MSDRRYVLDTNIIVSALLMPHSKPAQVLTTALAEGQVMQSVGTLAELNEVFLRDKFNKYLTLSERRQLLANLADKTRLVEITVTITDCRDPKDNKFLELAVSGSATHIISGDEDLLVLHPFREITILAPADFLRSVGGEND